MHFLWYHSLQESHSAHQSDGDLLSQLSHGILHSQITGTSSTAAGSFFRCSCTLERREGIKKRGVEALE